MLWIAEIVITVLGLIMLCTGKTLGSDPVVHPHVRLVGLFWLLMLPVVLVLLVGAAVVYAIANPATVGELESGGGPTWVFGLGEFVLVIAYYAIGHAWLKSIKRKVTAQGPENDWSAPPAQQWGPPIPGMPRLPQG
jgi:hypothetical protein